MQTLPCTPTIIHMNTNPHTTPTSAHTNITHIHMPTHNAHTRIHKHHSHTHVHLLKKFVEPICQSGKFPSVRKRHRTLGRILSPVSNIVCLSWLGAHLTILGGHPVCVPLGEREMEGERKWKEGRRKTGEGGGRRKRGEGGGRRKRGEGGGRRKTGEEGGRRKRGEGGGRRKRGERGDAGKEGRRRQNLKVGRCCIPTLSNP